MRRSLLSAGLGLAMIQFTFMASENVWGQVEATTVPATAGENADQDGSDRQPTDVLVIENAQTSLIKNAFIAAPISGVVSSVDATEGDRVQRDTPLVKMLSDLAESELMAAKAALDAARLESDNDVNLRFAKRTLEVREHEMKESRLANQAYAGAVSNMELDEIGLKVDQAALAIEQAQHELMIASAVAIEKQAAVRIAQTKLDRHTVLTSVDGMITQIDVEPGEWVDAGKPIVRIISLDPIRVECFVDGRNHGAELVGHAVQFIPTGATPEESLHGRVTFVSRELHPVSGQVRLWATVANPDGRIGSGAPGKLVVE